MKIAINLVGISYGIRDRDWRILTENNMTKLVDDLSKLGEVFMYLTTYKNVTTDELIEFYKPRKSIIMEFEGSDQRLTYAKSLENIVSEDVDLIVSTRFDMEFAESFSISTLVEEQKVDLNKVNFLFKESRHDPFVCDNFFIIPKHYLSMFIDAIHEEYANPARRFCTDLHAIYRRMREKIGDNNINFVSQIEQRSNHNSFYTLKRG
jgi:hypothetical protein